MTGKIVTHPIDNRNRQPRGVATGGQFAVEQRPEPAGDLALRPPGNTALASTGWTDRIRTEHNQARVEASRLEELHWQARSSYDEAPSSTSDPALKEYGAPTWDDAVHKVEGEFRSSVATAADIAEKHYREAGCKWAAYHARDMTDAAVTRRESIKPIVKRSGKFVAETRQAVETLQADPEWEPARAATESLAEKFNGVLTDRRGSKARNRGNDETKSKLLRELNARKAELKVAYDRSHAAENQMRTARILDASGVPTTAVEVGLRQRDVLAINQDGSTNLWARGEVATLQADHADDHHDGEHDHHQEDPPVRAEELFQKVVTAEPMEGPGGGLRLTLADGTQVSSVAREERQFYGRPRVVPGAALELYAEPPALGSRRASEVFGGRFARVGGHDNLY
ncbi:hypothetical protein LG293_16750 (plasmid) [Citricoccus nitrophenolicus]